jgi:hypothetical protein
MNRLYIDELPILGSLMRYSCIYEGSDTLRLNQLCVAIRMKFIVVCRKLYDYVRYDLKEIMFPSSLPDHPSTKRRPKLTLKHGIL